MPSSRGAAPALGLAIALLVGAVPRAPEARPVGVVAPACGAARLLWRQPLDVNAESPAALEALPGIGPGRARAIAAARPFGKVSDLTRVPGIGPRTVDGLAGLAAAGSAAGARCGEEGD